MNTHRPITQTFMVHSSCMIMSTHPSSFLSIHHPIFYFMHFKVSKRHQCPSPQVVS